MRKVISSTVAACRDQLAQQFRDGDPFPHVVIDGFLESDFCARLIREFPPFDQGCSKNELGRRGGKATIENLRSLGAAFHDADDAFRSSDFLELVSAITGIDGLLYDPDYVGGGTHENLPGQDLDPHIDFNYHPKLGWHRRLNLIVYLNPEWRDDWGGSLELHLDPWLTPAQDRVKIISPIANRAVLFATSERSWHGFKAIKAPAGRPGLSRRSLALYLYTQTRPAAETAPSHSTVYVPRPLPGSPPAGGDLNIRHQAELRTALARRGDQVRMLLERDRMQAETARRQALELLAAPPAALDADVVSLIERVIQSEDDMIRSLYDREKELAVQMRDLETALSRPRLPLLESGTTTTELEGMWPDYWAGRRLRFAVRATKPIASISIRGHVPIEMMDGQHLSCTVAGGRHEQRFPPGDFEWNFAVSISCSDVHIEILAGSVWVPATSAASHDERQLAYRLLEVALQ